MSCKQFCPCPSSRKQGKAELVMDVVSSISRGRGYTLGAKQLVGCCLGAERGMVAALLQGIRRPAMAAGGRGYTLGTKQLVGPCRLTS